MSEKNNLEESRANIDSEISLVDIVEFIQESWKLLLGAGIVGAFIGLASWFAFTNYKATLLLQNNGGFDIISWRSTETILPNLAAEMLEKKAVPDNQVSLYGKISSPAWWSKNVQINYALTKSEIKNLVSLSKDLDVASNTIISFSISASAPSEERALEEVRGVAQFIRSAASYIASKNLIYDYETKSTRQFAEIQQKISAAEIEIGYLQERATHLAQLQKSYPSGGVSITPQIQQSADPKEASSKFLPIATQIIGVKNDIAASHESLKRLNDQLNKARTYKVFLEGAAPLMVGHYDGIGMVKNLLAVEEGMRAKTPPGDIKALQNLDTIRTQLIYIELDSRSRLVQNNVPTVSKSGSMLKNIATGSLVAGFLMLAFLFGRKALKTLKSSAKS